MLFGCFLYHTHLGVLHLKLRKLNDDADTCRYGGKLYDHSTVGHSKNPFKNLIYHIGTSLRNPFKVSDLQDMMYCYVTNNPWLNKCGKPGAFSKKLTVNPTIEDAFHQNNESTCKTQVN